LRRLFFTFSVLALLVSFSALGLAQEPVPSPEKQPIMKPDKDAKNFTSEQVAESTIYIYGSRNLLAKIRRNGVEVGRICRRALRPHLGPQASVALEGIEGDRLHRQRFVVEDAGVLERLAGDAWIEINPSDADRLSLRNGDAVRILSRRGQIDGVMARVTATVRAGEVFLPFHFDEWCANRLTVAEFDPISREPNYKQCAVRLVRVGTPS